MMCVRTVLLLLGLVLCAPPPALAQDYNNALNAFRRLPEQQRYMISLMLAATGHYSGMSNGEFNRRLHQAVIAFQGDLRAAPTGILSEEEQKALLVAGARFTSGIGIKEVEHPFAGAKLYFLLP